MADALDEQQKVSSTSRRNRDIIRKTRPALKRRCGLYASIASIEFDLGLEAGGVNCLVAKQLAHLLQGINKFPI
jgi:hypothetical protein